MRVPLVANFLALWVWELFRMANVWNDTIVKELTDNKMEALQSAPVLKLTEENLQLNF